MKEYRTRDLHSNNNSTVLRWNNILWMSPHTLEFIVCALLSVMLSAIKLAAAQTQYGPPIKVAPLAQPGSVTQIAVLDMNGDGFDDVLAASLYFPLQNAGIPIQILLNDGHGGFFDGTSQLITGPVPKTVHPRKIVIADFNGDGKPDIFIADHGYDAPPFPGAQSTLLLSTPDGHYVDATANLPQQLAYTHSATAADIDGSGHMALYMGNHWYFGQMVQIHPQLLLNDGTGHFTISSGRLPAQTDVQQNQYSSSEFVDVNGDGCPDLVLGGDGNTQSLVLINDCTGHFSVLPNALPAKLFADGITVDIKPIKLGSSGTPDLLLSLTHQTPPYEGRAIQVLINNGDGTFHDESAQRLGLKEDTGNWITLVHLADTNGDCSPDIFPQFSGGASANEVRIYTNDGTGHFTRQTSGLPSAFYVTHPIDVNHNGQIGFISVGDGFYLTPVISGSRCVAPVDFDGDRKRDIAVYRSGTWFTLRSSDGGATTTQWGGLPQDIPVPEDYDGDGKTDVAVYRDGTWWILRSRDGGVATIGWGGLLTDVPVPADYDGDGKADIAVYRDGTWFILRSSDGGQTTVGWGGLPQDIPVPADYDGDGKTDIAVYRDGTWFIKRSSDSGIMFAGWGGLTQDVPVPADYDGDGKVDIAIYRDRSWFIRRSSDGGITFVGWGGLPQDVPVPGDYDGDRKTDIAVYRDGTWFIIRSSDGRQTAVGWGGLPQDIPIN